MILDPVENVHTVFAVHHVDRQAPLAKTARAADPVKVRLVVGLPVLVDRQVEVDHHGHLFHVDP